MTTDATIPFDPTAPEQRENPFDVLALARREQPVFHAPGLDLWVVTRHEEQVGGPRGTASLLLATTPRSLRTFAS